LLERVALAFPDLRIVIAHMGHPWERDTIVLIRKQPNVYADISALFYRPWQFYNTLVLCDEYGQLHKLFFGSDYPVTTPQESIEKIRRINAQVEGTSLPRVPHEALEEIINRDSLSILGVKT
ncbi:MAG: amidohydrolase family protein, partial [Candidatus Bathyarchaeia archaeon]